ncbi:hypothetical protein A2U01_0045531, partial [Trifolium medium]|nr:hypothetical protein [Trifolium medium]
KRKYGGHRSKHPEEIGYRNRVGRTTSFYVTNFPDSTTTTELWELFSKYWKCGEVFIPKKLDKSGKRFGFARFEDVVDQQRLLSKIEETWIGTYKIRANLPRFGRGEGPKEQHEEEIERLQPRNRWMDPNHRVDEISYKQVVTGQERHGNPMRTKERRPLPKVLGRSSEEIYREGVLEVEMVPENLAKLQG